MMIINNINVTLKEHVLKKINELKAKGIKEIELSELVKEIVKEANSTIGAVYSAVKELEIKEEIKTKKKGNRTVVIIWET